MAATLSTVEAEMTRLAQASAQAEVSHATTCALVRQQLDHFQTSIIHAQDHLADDDAVGREALKTMVLRAEDLHRAVIRLHRQGDHYKQSTVLATRLSEVLRDLKRQGCQVSLSAAPVTETVVTESEQLSASEQLTRLTVALDRLADRKKSVCADQVIGPVSQFTEILEVLAQQTTEESQLISRILRTIGSQEDSIKGTLKKS